jgi:hypothetical protein
VAVTGTDLGELTSSARTGAQIVGTAIDAASSIDLIIRIILKENKREDFSSPMLSELEGCLDYTTPVRGVFSKALIIASIEDSGSDADVVRHLILVEELKKSRLLKVLTCRCLADSNTSGITINKYVIPLKACHPGLTVGSSTLGATYSVPTITKGD